METFGVGINDVLFKIFEENKEKYPVTIEVRVLNPKIYPKDQKALKNTDIHPFDEGNTKLYATYKAKIDKTFFNSIQSDAMIHVYLDNGEEQIKINRNDFGPEFKPYTYSEWGKDYIVAVVARIGEFYFINSINSVSSTFDSFVIR